MSVKIFVMTHKQFEVPDDPMYIPLHVGHKTAKETFGYLGDDTGDNISELNCYYAELSGVYWVWKNDRNTENVGICHYRRYLTSEEGYVFTEAEYEQILSEYDIITTKLLELPGSYRDGFGAHHNINTLDETGRVILELCPEYYDTFVRLVYQNRTYFGNIMVAKKSCMTHIVNGFLLYYLPCKNALTFLLQMIITGVFLGLFLNFCCMCG